MIIWFKRKAFMIGPSLMQVFSLVGRLMRSTCKMFKAKMNSDILLQTATTFFFYPTFISKVYWIGVCHGLFHLHGLPRAVRSGCEIKKILKNLDHSGTWSRDPRMLKPPSLRLGNYTVYTTDKLKLNAILRLYIYKASLD